MFSEEMKEPRDCVFVPRVGLAQAVFVAKYISHREKLQMKVSLIRQKL